MANKSTILIEVEGMSDGRYNGSMNVEEGLKVNAVIALIEDCLSGLKNAAKQNPDALTFGDLEGGAE